MPAAAVAAAYERHLAVGEAAQEVSAVSYAAEEGAEEDGNVDVSRMEETAARREDTPSGEGVETGVRSNGFEGEDFVGVTREGVGNAGENQPQTMSVDGAESACGPDRESQVRGAR